MRALALALICTACIERPFEEPPPAQARAQVDRSALRDVLVPPPGDATIVGAVFGNALIQQLQNPARMLLPEKLV